MKTSSRFMWAPFSFSIFGCLPGYVSCFHCRRRFNRHTHGCRRLVWSQYHSSHRATQPRSRRSDAMERARTQKPFRHRRGQTGCAWFLTESICSELNSSSANTALRTRSCRSRRRCRIPSQLPGRSYLLRPSASASSQRSPSATAGRCRWTRSRRPGCARQ